LNYEPFCGYWFYGVADSILRAHYYSSWGLLEDVPTPKFNYKPFCGYWFYGAANDYQRAHYYSSWGLLANVPTAGGILRRISILTGLDSILGG